MLSDSMKNYAVLRLLGVIAVGISIFACVTGGEVVQVTKVSNSDAALEDLGEEELAQLAEFRKAQEDEATGDVELEKVVEQTPNYSVEEYLALPAGEKVVKDRDYRVGGYDIIDIIVYEEEDLSREKVRISADGFISFPLIGRLKVAGMTTSEIENSIALKLAEGQFMLDAHVSVIVTDYLSKQFMVLGSVKEPGSYALREQERLLDAISKAGGIDFEQGGKQGMIIRTENPGAENQRKIVIKIDLPALLKGGDQFSNLPLTNKDLIYIPKADYFYIIGQVQAPGSYAYLEKEITLVEAIGKSGGFTPIAARNRTRIIRVEDGVEKIIEVKVDEITEAGKKGQDILIQPGDVIVVPESFF